jgi:hypothetical protein
LHTITSVNYLVITMSSPIYPQSYNYMNTDPTYYPYSTSESLPHTPSTMGPVGQEGPSMHSLQLSPAFATKPQPARQIHRNRASYSCHSCRRRKVKCDQVHPTCGNCTKHNDVCTYNDNSNIKSKKKDKKIKTEPGLEDMHRRSASKSSIDETYGSISKCWS